MIEVFADTNYWVAKINQHDQWHEAALQAEHRLGIVHLVVTESVLIELLNYFSCYAAPIRQAASSTVRQITTSTEIEVVAQTHDDFLNGISLYEARPDKDYSLTDCISMNVMRKRGITDVLTHDSNFSQERFRILL